MTLYAPTSHAEHCKPFNTALYPAKHLQSINSSLPDVEDVCKGHAMQFPAPAATLYVPAPHAEHCPTPVATLYFPASHAVQATPSEAAVYPTTHLQSINSLLPDAELVHVGHVEHCPVPVAALYLPAEHALHATPSDVPLYPAMHLQSVNALLPNEELVPTGHVEHCRVPIAALYLPTEHATQGPASTPVYPATHLQSVSSSLPEEELVPVGHTEHCTAPGAILYSPASQVSHATPSYVLLRPAKQITPVIRHSEKLRYSSGPQSLCTTRACCK